MTQILRRSSRAPSDGSSRGCPQAPNSGSFAVEMKSSKSCQPQDLEELVNVTGKDGSVRGSLQGVSSLRPKSAISAGQIVVRSGTGDLGSGPLDHRSDVDAQEAGSIEDSPFSSHIVSGLPPAGVKRSSIGSNMRPPPLQTILSGEGLSALRFEFRSPPPLPTVPGSPEIVSTTPPPPEPSEVGELLNGEKPEQQAPADPTLALSKMDLTRACTAGASPPSTDQLESKYFDGNAAGNDGITSLTTSELQTYIAGGQVHDRHSSRTTPTMFLRQTPDNSVHGETFNSKTSIVSRTSYGQRHVISSLQRPSAVANVMKRAMANQFEVTYKMTGDDPIPRTMA